MQFGFQSVNLELSQLRWAIVVAQHRSLRQAAEVLNVRQSTLSRRLRALEYQLGSALFKRTNGGTKPTIEGQEFLEAARRIVEESDAITEQFKTRSRGEIGCLTIGVHSSLSAGNLRATLIEHRQRFPNVQIHLVDGSSDHLISDLASFTIDIAFLLQGNSRWDGKSLPVWSERVVAAIPEQHPLIREDVIHWSQLRGAQILMPQRGPGPEFLNLLVGKIGSLDGFQLQRHDISLDRLLTLVGVGAGILLALEGATGGSYPSVAFREVHDHEGQTRLGFRAIWRQENCNPSLRPVLGMLLERYPDLSSGATPP